MDLFNSFKNQEEYLDIIIKIFEKFKNKNKKCSLGDLIKEIHSIYPELETFSKENSFSLKLKDKGSLGKIVEFELFGNLPNNKSETDLSYADIKTTHFKENKYGEFIPKERLTITNIGNPLHSFHEWENNTNDMTHYSYYKKLKNNIIFIFKYEKDKVDLYEKELLKISKCNLENLSIENKDILKKDFNLIRNLIIRREPTQRGQEYLHIHKHGGKGSKTRALGFTPKFLKIIYSL